MDVAEQNPNVDESVAINGDAQEELEQEYQEQHQEGEESGRGMENVDSAGEEIRHSAGDSSSGKIFVGGVAWDTTEDTFSRHFERYGHITDSVIMRDKHTRMPRGFGFVTFADPSVVKKVLEDEHVIDGRTVEVKRTVPREDMAAKEGPKTKKIFVGGIPPSLTEDELKNYFSSYGTVVEHQIMMDHNSGRSRGFGFVTFEGEESVEELMSEGKTHELGGKQVEIKKAEPKRAGGDYSSDRRAGYGGANLYGGGGGGYAYRGGYNRAGGGYGGRIAGSYGGGRAAGGYGRYSGGRGAAGYSGYGGDRGIGPAGIFSGYAGYGYGVGFGSGYGGSMYGAAGFDGGDGYDSPVGGYGAAYSGYGGYGSGRGYGNGAAASGRYHPYGR